MILQTERSTDNYNQGVNRPDKLTAKTDLMQNYTIPVDMADGYEGLAVGFDQMDRLADPVNHVFVVDEDDANQVAHYFPSLTDGTMWQKETYDLPNGDEVKMMVTGQEGNGRLVVFALTDDNYRIYYRRVTDVAWSDTGINVDNDCHNVTISAAYFAGQLRLALGYTQASGNKSQAFWIDWSRGSGRYTSATPQYDQVYTVAAGSMVLPGRNGLVNGMLIAWREHHDSHRHVSFFEFGKPNSAAYDFVNAKTSDHHYKDLVISPYGNDEFLGRRSDGHIHYYDGDTAHQRLFDGYEIKRFCVTQPAAEEESEFSLQVFAISDDNNNKEEDLVLYSSKSKRTQTWSDSLAIKSNTHIVQAASRDQFVNLFTVSNEDTGGMLMMLQRTPGASDWRTLPISTPLPDATEDVKNGEQIAVGLHQMSPSAAPVFNLFKIRSGSQGKISRYIQTDPVNDLWDKESYDLPNGRLATQIACTQNELGELTIAALDTHLNVYYRVVGQSQWDNFGPLEGVNDITDMFIAAGRQEGGIGIFVGVNRPNNHSRAFELSYRSSTGEKMWGWQSTEYKKVYAIASGYYTYNGTRLNGAFVSAKTDDNQYQIQWYPYQNSIYQPWPVYGRNTSGHYSQIQAQVNGEDGVFALKSSDKRLYLYRGNGSYDQLFPSDQIAEFVVALPNSPTSGDKQQVFGLTTGGKIKVTVQNSNGSWSSPTQIASDGQALSGMSTRVGDHYYSGLADMRDTYVHDYVYAAGWQSGRISLKTGEATGQPTEFASYMTQVTIGDMNEQGVASAPVSFLPNDSEIDVSLNGVTYRLNPTDEPLTLVTDSRGKATFTVTATTLATPQLLIWSDSFMSADDALLVQPNGEQQSVLANVNKNQLQNAQKKDGSGGTTDLFSDKGVVDDHFVNSVNDAMGLADGTPDMQLQVSAKSRWLGSRSTPGTTQAVRRSQAHKHRHLQNGPNVDKHFMITFGHGRRGRHRHVRLNRQTAATQFSRVSKSGRSSEGTPFNGSFGDIMRSAIDGDITLHELVITRQGTSAIDCMDGVTNFFKAAVSFVWDGITYVWDKTVSLIQEAFDLAEAIFADVKVMFQDIFAWLGNFFLWGDVLNTQTFLKEFALEMLNSLPAIVRSSETYISDAVQQFLDVDVSGLISNPNLDGNTTVNQTVAQTTDPDADAHTDSPQANWLIDQFTQMIDSIEFLLEFAESLESAVMDLLSEMLSILEQAVVDDFQIALKSLSDLIMEWQGGASLNQLVDQGLEATQEIVARILQALAEIVIASLDTIGNQIIPVMIELLDAPIAIPLLSDLYTQVINPGHELSILDLVTLLGALPATFGYKASMGLLGQGLIPPVIAKESDRDSAFQICLEGDLIGSISPNNFLVITPSASSGGGRQSSGGRGGKRYPRGGNGTTAVNGHHTIEFDTNRHPIQISQQEKSTINFVLGTVSNAISALNGILGTAVDEFDIAVKRAEIDDIPTLSRMTDRIMIICNGISLCGSLIGAGLSYPMGWNDEDNEALGKAQFGLWVYECVAFNGLSLIGLIVAGYYNRAPGAPSPIGENTPLLSSSNPAEAETLEDVISLGIDILTTIAGVVDGVFSAGVYIGEGLDLDWHDPVTVLGYVFSVFGTILSVTDEVLTVAKPFAIEVASKSDPETTLGGAVVVGVYDLIMGIIPAALNEAVAVGQLIQTARQN